MCMLPVCKFHHATHLLHLAIRALRNYPRRIKSYEEARGITGVGEKTAQKVSSCYLSDIVLFFRLNFFP
jgi:hypothetical protein